MARWVAKIKSDYQGSWHGKVYVVLLSLSMISVLGTVLKALVVGFAFGGGLVLAGLLLFPALVVAGVKHGKTKQMSQWFHCDGSSDHSRKCN